MTRQRSQPAPPFPDQPLTPPGIEADMNPRPRYEAPRYKPAGKLEQLTALITGGDSGIGRAVAVLFAREGADVSLVYLPVEQTDAEETAAAVGQAGRRCLLIAGDVTDREFCTQAVDRTLSEFNRLDILVNNAAYQQHQKTIGEVAPEQWDRTFRTNIYGYYYMARAAVPHLKPGATIINTGSVTGLEGSKELLDYSATKGAIHAFTKALGQNLIAKGIRVNCVAPGPVWTPLNPAEREAGAMEEFGAGTPLGRPAQPEEIAPAYVFLASEADSGYINGVVLPMLGGETIAG
jgi:NAD(P)-dependent dehydrogenase (short-subunit alcohol dehydrogenase family)